MAGSHGESFLSGPNLPTAPAGEPKGSPSYWGPGSALATGPGGVLLIGGPEAVGPARGKWFGGDSTDSSCGVSEDP